MSQEYLGDFVDLLGGVGRVHPEDVSQTARTPVHEAFERDKAMRRKIDKLFSTKNGQDVLAWLWQLTAGRPVLPFETLGTMTAEDRLALAHFREGQNEVVRLIVLSIKQNRGGDSDV